MQITVYYPAEKIRHVISFNYFQGVEAGMQFLLIIGKGPTKPYTKQTNKILVYGNALREARWKLVRSQDWSLLQEGHVISWWGVVMEGWWFFSLLDQVCTIASASPHLFQQQ